MAESYLTSLVTPTLAMYGAAPKDAKITSIAAKASTLFAKKPAPAPAVPAAPAPAPDTRGVGMALAGFALATGVASGVSALVGRTMYPEVGAARFAKVGALSYAVPAGLLLAVSSFYVAQKKKSDAEIRQGSAS
jgi:hypothetical protein